MAPPRPFAVEQWMDEHETTAKYQLAETCCASISLDELAQLSDNKATTANDIISTATIQDYGEIKGSFDLRNNLSKLYSSRVNTPLPPDNILITPGAIAANHLVLYSLISPGDHVICYYPTYQQLYSIPESLGAEVDLWRSDPAQEWQPNLATLKALIKPNTKLIIINNPQNPTGAVLGRSLLSELVEFAHSRSILVLADEVYRPIFHGITPVDSEFPPSILSLGFSNTIATGSLSKAYSLAGIRVGWVASRSAEVLERCAATRHYTTISVSKLDQAVAAFALSSQVIHSLLGRNLALARENLVLLERFVIKHDEYCSWTKPVAGTTAFIKFERDGKSVDTKRFCEMVLEKTGVMLLPGEHGFGPEFKGYVRIGYVNRTEVVRDGLEALRIFMRKEYDDVPLCE